MTSKSKIVVAGAGGFIGHHLVKRLKAEGCWVRGVDLKYPEYSSTTADDFVIGDLRDPQVCDQALSGGIEQLFQLAADMGGAGYIFTGDNDADIMHNSAAININMVNLARKKGVKKIFYSSSACIYPDYNQKIQTTRIAKSRRHIRHTRIVNMGGKSFSASACTCRLPGTAKWRFILRVSIIFSAPKAHGLGAGKRPLRRSVVKWPWPQAAERLKSGETGNKRGLSFSLMNALRERRG